MDTKVVLTKTNPLTKANILSKTLFTWVFSVFRTGYSRELTQDDLFVPTRAHQSAGLGDALEREWEEERERARARGGRPSLAKCIVRLFWIKYMMWGAGVGMLFVLLWPLIPYTLSLLIGYFSSEKTPADYRYAHVYNFLLNALSISTTLVFNHVNLGQSLMGMQVRIACCSLLYRKLLRLNHLGLGKTTPGHIVNLLSNDVNRFDLAPTYLHYIWVMPIVVPVVCFLVWRHIGYATLAALAVIVGQVVLVQAYLSREQGVLRGKIARRTDERVRVMNELVNGVQVIKMYAWEKPFEKLVAQLRKMEINLIRKTSMIKGFSIALTVFTERFIVYAAVVTFVLLGGVIKSEITFSMVQYFNLLQLACNIFVPMALAVLGEAQVTVRRLEEFLLLEELPGLKKDLPPMIKDSKKSKKEKRKKESKEKSEKDAPEKEKFVTNETEKKKEILEMNGAEREKKERTRPTGLVLVNASASWLPDPIASTLRNITLSVKPGEFLGIAGPVGSGKSSLLHMLLGELPLSRGSLSLGGAKLSYASQEPWLFNATVRQNILFGQTYDKVRYNKVVSACALLRDFELLPHGDGTLVGERGVSLSGGQRARIGLARACYAKADVYLLDDPLSAVDTHVGRHLVRQCVCGLLRHSTRILVTHQLHHLSGADRILVLGDGEIEAEGTFEEVSKNPLFSELLEEEEEKESEQETTQRLRPRTRTMSIHSQSSEGGAGDVNSMLGEEDAAETEELMEKGRVAGSVYVAYMRAGGGWGLLLFTLLSFVLAQAVTSCSDLWLTAWMDKADAAILANRTSSEAIQNITQYITTTPLPDITTTLPDATQTVTTTVASTGPDELIRDLILENTTRSAGGARAAPKYQNADHYFYIYVWTALILGCVIITTERSLLFLWVCMRASVGLHNTMFGNILQATMRFFDTNPSGRILNRFSKDMGLVDEVLPRIILEGAQVFMVMLGILVMVAIMNPYMLLTTAVCAVLMYIMSVFYLHTSQTVKRLEGVTRSPVFSHVTASLGGLRTVRACGAEAMLRRHFDNKQDVHTAAWYLMLVTNATFSVWLSLVSASYVVVVAYTFLLTDDGTTKSGHVGLAISQSLIMVNMVQYGIKAITEVISQMTSVERILQYTKLPKERPLESPAGARVSPAWPERARVVMKDVYLRYEEGGEPVLRNLNLVIESGWKVGVVGRTGAGKSSLISALFRLAIVDGDILIDDVNTAQIGLKDLRSKLSIIPQEPVLFSASLRYNLDPFDKHSDADIWKALEQVELKHAVTSLSSAVTEGGSNYSAGQRQLLCLARAALNNNKILVLDEATANVDPKTDSLIQTTIRTAFADCTVITVAHRLHTVADSDRVLVMDAGQAVQYAHPHTLLQDRAGVFAQMVAQLGPAAESSLRDIARQHHAKHIQYVDAD